MSHWASFNGWCLAHGQRPASLGVADLCDLIYYWLTHRLTSEDRQAVDRDLLLPPATILAEGNTGLAGTAWSAEAEMAAFMAAG